MEIKYFDSHSHLNFSQYDEDREDIINKMHKEGIATICVGTDLKTSQESVELATKYDHVWATVGLHPTDDEEFDEDVYKNMITDRVVGIGECGLDYFREKNRTEEDKERQSKIFLQQVKFAVEVDLPLMIHCRPSNGSMDAYEDALSVLEEYYKEQGTRLRGNAHFFVGNIDIAERFLNLGFTIAFPGVITFTDDYDDVVRYVPLDRILSETDAPFAAPAPYRGERNSPLYVNEVVSAIGRIKGEGDDVVKEYTINNAKRLFSLE